MLRLTIILTLVLCMLAVPTFAATVTTAAGGSPSGTPIFPVLFIAAFAAALLAMRASMSDTFDGSFASGSSIQISHDAPNAYLLNFEGIENFKAPEDDCKEDTYTTLSGTYVGKERVLAASKSAGTLTITATFEATRYAALLPLVGRNGCEITVTLPTGAYWSGTGFLKTSAVEQCEDSKHMRATFTVRYDAGWMFSGASTGQTVVPEYSKTFTTTGSIDLTHCGAGSDVSLAGDVVTKMVLWAPSTNTQNVTVAVGASNGYDLTTTFSQIIKPGERFEYCPVRPETVGGSACILDVTCTGAQVLRIYIEAETA